MQRMQRNTLNIMVYVKLKMMITSKRRFYTLQNFSNIFNEKETFTIDLNRIKIQRHKRFDEMQVLYEELVVYGRMKQKSEYLEDALLITLI
jgi:hypothetical protein